MTAPFDPAAGRLPTEAVTSRIGDRTRWVAITGASNALGTTPDLPPIVAAAHDVGARVFVDGVHLVPHRRIDVSTLGCDVLATSAYKWYGPHAGMLCADPDLLARLDPDKVRPAPDAGPARYETGTPAFEAIAGIRAAAEFLAEVDVDAEMDVFAPMLHGLLAMPHVTVWGPHDLVDRTPTLAFTVAGHHPDDVARRLADARVAVWSGDYYAVDVMASLGLAESGGAVRAGVVCYTEPEDVARLLQVVDRTGLELPPGGFAFLAGGADRVALGVAGRDPLLAAQRGDGLAGHRGADDVVLAAVVREAIVVAVVGPLDLAVFDGRLDRRGHGSDDGCCRVVAHDVIVPPPRADLGCDDLRSGAGPRTNGARPDHRASRCTRWRGRGGPGPGCMRPRRARRAPPTSRR